MTPSAQQLYQSVASADGKWVYALSTPSANPTTNILFVFDADAMIVPGYYTEVRQINGLSSSTKGLATAKILGVNKVFVADDTKIHIINADTGTLTTSINIGARVAEVVTVGANAYAVSDGTLSGDSTVYVIDGISESLASTLNFAPLITHTYSRIAVQGGILAIPSYYIDAATEEYRMVYYNTATATTTVGPSLSTNQAVSGDGINGFYQTAMFPTFANHFNPVTAQPDAMVSHNYGSPMIPSVYAVQPDVCSKL